MTEDNLQNAKRLSALLVRMRRIGVGILSSGMDSVSPAQMALLDLIAVTNGCGVQDIADQLHLTPPTVSVGVRKLEESGLITRKAHPQDKRAVQLFLTEEGKNIHSQTQAIRLMKTETILMGLTPEEQKTFLRLFEKAIQSAESRQ